MSNPYQPAPPDPYGGQPPTQSYGYPQQPAQTPPPSYGYPPQAGYAAAPTYPAPQYAQAGYQQPAHPGYQQPGYAQPGYPQQAYGPTGEPNTLANAAVTLGLVSIVGLFVYGIGLLCAIPGIWVGILALKKSRVTGTGRGLAIGALVLSVLGLLISAAVITVFVLYTHGQL
ncbi:DUF4190 domain-containing protein [Streptacidiphilus albus]|uniref:DUF4190 domain-containing protein n=1 Tax=Streptacidiphilus albus TaxID=105425 RepID=UPI00068C34EC|nr:DUF4190 domain-containing protein [Streptacidiphilus albus]